MPMRQAGLSRCEVVDGQKTKAGRPRVRSSDGHEQELGSCELFLSRRATR